jgi:hypothetical protein
MEPAPGRRSVDMLKSERRWHFTAAVLLMPAARTESIHEMT